MHTISGIRAIPNRPVNSTTVNGINSAILRYDGAPTKEPRSRKQPKDLVMLKESDLHVSQLCFALPYLRLTCIPPISDPFQSCGGEN